MSILHTFVSIVPDGADGTQIQPQRDWNATHVIEAGTITDTHVATANKDGAAGTASMRTLGAGATQACGGTDARLSDARTPTAHTHAASDITSGLAAIATSGSAADLGAGFIPDARMPDLTGDVTTVQGAVATTIGAHKVTRGMLAQGAGLSVVGVTGASTADDADIVGTADQVFRVDSAGVVLGFGSIVQASVTNLGSDLALKAPLASPSLTGVPLSTTPSSGDNSTKIATTAFVADAISGVGGTVTTIVEVDLGAFATSGTFTITEAGSTTAKKIAIWQHPGPYTGKGTLADAGSADPLVLSAEALNGSIKVRWQSMPRYAWVWDVGSPSIETRSAPQDDPQARGYMRRVGGVRGNFKFIYQVLT